MLIGPSLVGTPLASTSNLASYATASLSPSANALLLVGVWNTDASNAINPVVTSAFATGGWTNEGSVQNSTFVTRISMHSAITTGTPGSGAVTAAFGGDAQTGCIIIVIQYTGHDGTDPVIQVTTHGHSGAGVTSKTVTLASALGSADNHCFSFVGHNANEVQTAGGGATAATDVGYNTPANRCGAYHEVNDNSHSVSWSTLSVGNWVACEVVAAAAGAVVLPQRPVIVNFAPVRAASY